MRTCKEFIDVIPDYPKGQMDPDVARDLDQHLTDCPRCLDLLAEDHQGVPGGGEPHGAEGAPHDGRRVGAEVRR